MKSHARRTVRLVVGAAIGIGAACSSGLGQVTDTPAPDLIAKVDYNTFKASPAEFRGTRWFTFGMDNMNDAWVTGQLEQAAQDDAYGQWMATPSGARGGFGRGRRGGPATGPADAPPPAPPPAPAASYLNDEFFRVYTVAIAVGLKRKLPLRILYDEQQFPTGFAGGLFRQK